MTVGELKKLLENINDNVQVVNCVMMEQGRGCAGGTDFAPTVEMFDKGEFDFLVDDEEETNDDPWLVIYGSCEENWSD